MPGDLEFYLVVGAPLLAALGVLLWGVWKGR